MFKSKCLIFSHSLSAGFSVSSIAPRPQSIELFRKDFCNISLCDPHIVGLPKSAISIHFP